MTAGGRLETLTWISGQLGELLAHLESDVSSDKDDASGIPGGCVAYSLKATIGEPLLDVAKEALDISMGNLRETAGYVSLAARCEELEWRVRIDKKFYSEHPTPSSIFRVVVDGWS
jgi:hypothetical protein